MIPGYGEIFPDYGFSPNVRIGVRGRDPYQDALEQNPDLVLNRRIAMAGRPEQVQPAVNAVANAAPTVAARPEQAQPVAASDPVMAAFERNLRVAQNLLSQSPDPGGPYQINTIRGTTPGMVDLNDFDRRRYDDSMQRFVYANALLNNYKAGLSNSDLQKRQAEADINATQAKADQSRFIQDALNDPVRFRKVAALQGVDPNIADRVSGSAVVPRAPGSLPTGQDLPGLLTNPENQYLSEFFSPKLKNVGNAADVFDQIIKASPPEASDPETPLGSTILGGMRQRFPDSFGTYPSDPNTYGLAGLGVPGAAWANRNLLGPAVGLGSLGYFPTWNWEQNNQRGQALEDFFKRHNDVLKKIGFEKERRK